MSIPITTCMIRKSLDKNNFQEVGEIMYYNRFIWKLGFSIIDCKGHLFRKKCIVNKKEMEKFWQKIEEYLKQRNNK